MKKGIVTIKDFGGMSMLKYSEFHKNGKPLTSTYTFPGDFQKKIDKKIVACKVEMSKYLPKIMTEIGKLTKKSDRDEMYEFAIDISKKKIKELEKFQTDLLDMLPPPISEPDRQVSNFMISNHKSDIVQLEKAIKLQ